MTCFLPTGGKRPILDVNSSNLIFLWNVPNNLRIGDLKKQTLSNFGRVRFIETFEAWTKQKIGQLIIEFDTADGLGKFVQALSNKEIMNFVPPINFLRFNPGVGKDHFFNHVHKLSGVDLLTCGAIPPSFDWHKQSVQTPNKVQLSSASDLINVSRFSHSRPVNNFAKTQSSLSHSVFQSRSECIELAHNNVDSNKTSNNVNVEHLNNDNGTFGRNFGVNRSPVGRIISIGGRGGRGGGLVRQWNNNGNNENDPPLQNTQQKDLINPGGFGRGRGRGGRGGSELSHKIIESVEPNVPQFENEQQKDGINFGGFGRCRGRGGRDGKEAFWPRRVKATRPTYQQQQEELNSGDEDFIDTSGYRSDEDKQKPKSDQRSVNTDNQGMHGTEHSNSTDPSAFPIAPTSQEVVPQQILNKDKVNGADFTVGGIVEKSNSPKPPDYQTIRAHHRDASLSSMDDMEIANKKKIFIRNLKPGFSLNHILETLQNFGDIIRWMHVDKNTASFEFLEANEARMALLSAYDELEQLLGSDIVLELV